VILSVLCTLGLSVLFIRFVIGDPGLDASIPTFAFIFLVALGIDYTIFLMGRVREEARRHGTREGTLRALSATGPVITSAGLILAGTFGVLMTLPVTYTFDLGFMVALGILLDTFIVRTIMVGCRRAESATDRGITALKRLPPSARSRRAPAEPNPLAP
jgi:RND superfamily putative drug exporter